MTAIAPNGVAVASYDPKGIGAMIFAGVTAAGYAGGDLTAGQTIDGALLKFAGCSTASDSTLLGDVVGVGTWMCLGYLADGGTSVTTTLFMRVS